MLTLIALAALSAPVEASHSSARHVRPSDVNVEVYVDVDVDVDAGSAHHRRPRPLRSYFPPPQRPPPVVSQAELLRLVDAVEDATWSDDQADLIARLGKGRRFTCEQVLQLIEPIAFSDDRLDAVQSLRSRIVDPQNFYVLEAAFPFSSDRQDLRRMF